MADSRHAVSSEDYARMLPPAAVVGAAVFFIGGKFLYEIKHVSFLVSEVLASSEECF
jgi:hypothetical protein